MGKWNKHGQRRDSRRWIVRQLIKAHGCVCGICGEEISRLKDVTLDHIVPRSKGGSDEITNLQLAHDECNQDKSNMLPEEYTEWKMATT